MKAINERITLREVARTRETDDRAYDLIEEISIMLEFASSALLITFLDSEKRTGF